MAANILSFGKNALVLDSVPVSTQLRLLEDSHLTECEHTTLRIHTIVLTW